MRIGELAARTGSSVRSLRYYEQQGLLASTRGPNGYREYDDTAVALVREIRALLAAGFDLDEARPLVDCVRAGIVPRSTCPGSADAYRRKLATLDERLRDLHHLRDRVAADLAALEQAAPPDGTCRCGGRTGAHDPPQGPTSGRRGAPRDVPTGAAASVRR